MADKTCRLVTFPRLIVLVLGSITASTTNYYTVWVNEHLTLDMCKFKMFTGSQFTTCVLGGYLEMCGNVWGHQNDWGVLLAFSTQRLGMINVMQCGDQSPHHENAYSDQDCNRSSIEKHWFKSSSVSVFSNSKTVTERQIIVPFT